MNPQSDLVSIDPWKIIQSSFSDENNRKYESLFSIGNGHMGQRANLEESFSGNSLSGSYMAGVYYPDKTRVGWWKNGYPEYFAKVINAANWIGIRISLNGQELDLNQCKVVQFSRELDMQNGLLSRTSLVTFPTGEQCEISSERFCSMSEREIGAIQYQVKLIKGSGRFRITSILDGDVMNEDSNYDMKFWEETAATHANHQAYLELKTKKLDFRVGSAMKFTVAKNGAEHTFKSSVEKHKKFIGLSLPLEVEAGDEVSIEKIVSLCTNRDYQETTLENACNDALMKATSMGYQTLRKRHCEAWSKIWKDCDIEIKGDTAAQQAIRFNIFHLYQTYTGHDPRLNIGPKGFTGEKYGGSTYWDTEAYCLPFYLATTDDQIARNLLIYRHHHLPKAIENAEKLGFKNGAALYPMVTMNGEECHNEWEITFEEIHRNGAIAYAIYNYVNYTDDKQYLIEYGFDVLCGIARFWSQRVSWSVPKQQYVMLGVTGPNEYENNVNNNWYTNYIAAWCLRYAAEVAKWIRLNHENEYIGLCERLKIAGEEELEDWLEKSSNMFLPEDESQGIVLQQEGYLDKEDITADELDPAERPLNQHWSWDRILRSPFIKQADVLQGFYFFEDHFSDDELAANFDFYEPRTVHESSLSPCIHAVLAAKLGYIEKAYEMYLRTARLDLDDYNREVGEGLHITSMAGTWIALVQGFGGMRTNGGELRFAPMLPEGWESLTFSIVYRKARIGMTISKHQIKLWSDRDVSIKVYDQVHQLIANEVSEINP